MYKDGLITMEGCIQGRAYNYGGSVYKEGLIKMEGVCTRKGL